MKGIGTQFIDIGNASSRMKASELEFCNKNGVDVTEIKVGYDGIAVANSLQGETLKISKADLGMALTAEVPACYEGSGRSNNCDEWIANPFTKWSAGSTNQYDIFCHESPNSIRVKKDALPRSEVHQRNDEATNRQTQRNHHDFER